MTNEDILLRYNGIHPHGEGGKYFVDQFPYILNMGVCKNKQATTNIQRTPLSLGFSTIRFEQDNNIQ